MEDHCFETQNWESLVDTERQAQWNPLRFLARLSLQTGQDVLDLGCGPGFWTLPLAEIVGPRGTVWALDVAGDMHRALALRHPPSQVRPLRSELPRIGLPDQSVEWVWAAFILHEVGGLDALAAEVRRVSRPGGRVAVLDWRPDGESSGDPPRGHRLWPERIICAFSEAGFDIARHLWQDKDHYLLEIASRMARDLPPADPGVSGSPSGCSGERPGRHNLRADAS